MPASLVERAAEDEQRKLMVRAMRLGSSRDDAEKLAEERAARSREVAVRRLKGAYLMRKIADKERIYVLDSEVQEQVRALASRQGWTERRTERFLEENDLMGSLREEMREERTLKFLIENAQLVEIPREEFLKRMETKTAQNPQTDQQ